LKSFDEARKIYHVGIKRKARPFPRLRRNYEAFKRRMEFLKQHQDNEFYRVPINVIYFIFIINNIFIK